MSAVRRLAVALRDARQMLATRRRRTLLGAAGVMLAAAMLSAAVVIADGLGEGFNRAARQADLGDLIVRFDPVAAAQVQRRIGALPDLLGYSLRTEVTEAGVGFGGHRTHTAVGEVLDLGRRHGYALVAGRDLHGSGRDVLVETAWAQAWHIRVGSRIDVDGLGPETVVGEAEGPDDVGYPLAAPRFYLLRSQLTARFGARAATAVNFAEVWLRDPSRTDEVLVQARDESFGLRGLQFATRTGVQVLIGQAAGLIIDLLVALSAIALVTAAVMLAASARAEVQRRLRAFGIRRALGAGRGSIALGQGIEVGLVAVPAATIGTLLGWLATAGPGDRLLGLLNQPGPGTELILPLLAAWGVAVAVPLLGGAWPAWSAAGRSVITLLRGADVAARAPRTRRGGRSGGGSGLAGGGLLRLGVGLVATRRARLLATVSMLACSTAFVLLMIALAATLASLETDPQALGKRYQLTAAAAPARAAQIARLPGVAGAAPRYEVHAVDGYSLGEPIDVIAYPAGETARYEAPPLEAGRRNLGPHEAEVGVGLADALGLAPGSRLLLELPSGRQLSLTVSGTVSSLVDQGLVAYVPAAALLGADPAAGSQIAIILDRQATPATVSAELRGIGIAPNLASGAVARGAPLVAVLKVILRAVAIVDGLVCIYALIQACALTMQERRRTVAVLRATGADAAGVRRLLGGAVLALIVPAAILGVLLEALVLGPALSHLAAGYATLDLRPSVLDVLAVLAGLALAGLAAVVWVTRGAVREPVIRGLAG